jgi:hypothetical protein
MRDHQKVASLYGFIRRDSRQSDTSQSEDSESGNMPNLVLLLRAGEKVFETVADSNGSYAFFDLPAGTYKFDPVLPRGWTTGLDQRRCDRKRREAWRLEIARQ